MRKQSWPDHPKRPRGTGQKTAVPNVKGARQDGRILGEIAEAAPGIGSEVKGGDESASKVGKWVLTK